MRMVVENLTNVIYRFQGVFNADVFSKVAVHIESKMIIFTSGLLQGFRLFLGKFCIRLCFRLENGCAALKVQSP